MIPAALTKNMQQLHSQTLNSIVSNFVKLYRIKHADFSHRTSTNFHSIRFENRATTNMKTLSVQTDRDVERENMRKWEISTSLVANIAENVSDNMAW